MVTSPAPAVVAQKTWGLDKSNVSDRGMKVASHCTVILGAILLFLVQPLIAKIILPWFGGSAAVWTTCMLFFQSALFLGYFYAHRLACRFSPRTQSLTHIALLGVSLLTLPILPSANWKPADGQDPIPLILGLLTLTVGLPFTLLSATSPLVQTWYSRTPSGRIPYRLFAFSNLASLVALVGYPVLIEPNTRSSHQAWAWSGLYCAYALLCSYLAWQCKDFPVAPAPGADTDDPEADTIQIADRKPDWKQKLLWMMFAALASALMLAVSNHVCQDVAPVPFLWVAPLAVYLLSFILCFERDGWYHRPVFLSLHALALAGTGYLLMSKQSMNIRLTVVFLTCALFAFCMFCHGELARRKPAARYLTHFYLMISAGGAIGGLLVAVLAPEFLSGPYDLAIAVAACAFITLMLEYRKSILTDIVWAGLAVFLVAVAVAQVQGLSATSRVLARNFFGVVRVVDLDPEKPDRARRSLVHGRINHGTQFLGSGKQNVRTTYYSEGSGVDLAFQAFRRPGMKAALIGLGVGTLAAGGQQDDHYRFFEINPQVVTLAQTEFRFLKESAANVEVVTADGRLGLERDPDRYRIIVVDAFSGDSIPTHLLSVEAFRLYFQKLEPDGVLALHVSNTTLDLTPVIHEIAKKLGKAARTVAVGPDPSIDRYASVWVLVANSAEAFDQPPLRGRTLPLKTRRGVVAWTDDYSNLFSVLR